MILSVNQIVDLMEKPRNGDSIIAGAKLQKQHKLHITGEGYLEALEMVEGYEGTDAFNIRKQVAKPATIQITSIILDNLNRWTTAQGTVKKIDFNDKEKNQAFEGVLNQVWHGDSFEKFINTFYKEAIYTEFNGFAIVTKPKLLDGGLIERDGVISRRQNDTLDPYLIFISITDVHDYYTTGDKVEHIVIKLGDDSYRLIDDEKDVIFDYKKGSRLGVNLENAIPNELGYVPARMISAIDDNILSSQVKTSPIAHIIPALDRYFSTDADLRMQFIRHNYPKLAIVTTDCKACNGSGKTIDINSEDSSTFVTCSTCKGTGRYIPISRDGVISLPETIRSDDSPYPGSPASYITPDTDSLRLGLEDLDKQRQDIIYSGTGDKNLISESLNTATENLINSRSLEDRIKEITQMTESFEVFLKKAIKELHNDFRAISDYHIIVRYGKRISIKNEGELLQEMKDSKAAGMPSSYIAALHKDLIYAKYKNNTRELERQILLADLEPLAGYTIDELEKAKDEIFERDLQVKINFDSIISEIEQTTPLTYFMQDADYGARLEAINKKIDEILQKRVGASGLSRREDLEGVGENGTAPGSNGNTGTGTGTERGAGR